MSKSRLHSAVLLLLLNHKVTASMFLCSCFSNVLMFLGATFNIRFTEWFKTSPHLVYFSRFGSPGGFTRAFRQSPWKMSHGVFRRAQSEREKCLFSGLGDFHKSRNPPSSLQSCSRSRGAMRGCSKRQRNEMFFLLWISIPNQAIPLSWNQKINEAYCFLHANRDGTNACVLTGDNADICPSSLLHYPILPAWIWDNSSATDKDEVFHLISLLSVLVSFFITLDLKYFFPLRTASSFLNPFNLKPISQHRWRQKRTKIHLHPILSLI